MILLGLYFLKFMCVDQLGDLQACFLDIGLKKAAKYHEIADKTLSAKDIILYE